MRFLLFFLTSLCYLTTVGQSLSTEDRKAIKYYSKAGEEISVRNFEEGIELYRQAVQRDPNFSEALYRLHTVFQLYRQLDSAYKYLDKYAEVTPISRIPSKVAYSIAETYFRKGRYTDAEKFYKKAKEEDSKLAGSYRAILLEKSLDFAQNTEKNVQYEIKDLPESVNKYHNQYFPSITIDNQSLIFTKRDSERGNDDEDIVISEFRNGRWNEARPLSENLSTQYNEGAASVSADGRMLIFTSCEQSISVGSCDLFYATREGMQWSSPKNLGRNVNTIYWDSQPTLSADGKMLYFSSDRPGGYGRKDIWVTEFRDNEWTKPQNIGGFVNTPFDETTPYIHVNNTTLFFSSNGHPGFGGYDLFYSEKDSIWNRPINLGSGINDFNEQLSWVLTADGQTAYFALEGDINGVKRSKLVQLELKSDSLLKTKAAYVTGRVRNAENRKPIHSEIKLYDLESNEVVYSTTSDKVSGKYFISLNEGKEYGFFVSSEGFLFEDFHFEPTEREGLKPDTINISLQPIRSGASMILENIYFELDSYKLNKKSRAELEVISDFIKRNSASVLIEGHADLTGSDQYNMTLSKNRAKAVYDYLIDLGVDSEKLNYEGFGSTRPITQKAENQSKNRRIEFRIL